MQIHLVSVIIPVYLTQPSEFEKKSFEQCLKVLVNYPISIICPENFDISFYESQASKLRKQIIIERFSEKYFLSLKDYNHLMLSKQFYERFKNFKFILIYQLDAWVFRDELEFWCCQEFDVIGAPWINSNLFDWIKDDMYPKKLFYFHRFFGRGEYLCKVGNGGLSLRKVKSCSSNIKLFNKTASSWRANEDSFFSHYVKTFNPFFRVAPVKTALRFSFDIYPQNAYKMNNYNLPFGCHAWYRQESPYEENYTFWKDIIKNNELP